MLKNLKIMLGIASDDTSIDEKLKLIISTVSARLTMLLGGIEPPESMDHIVLEVSIKRFNRIGSEGMSNHSVEGESHTFAEDDFAAFSDEIQAFLDKQKESARGKVRFL
jgi:hypothetical protein